MDIQEKLKNAIASALEKFDIEKPNVNLEHPADLANGDYSTNVALIYAKQKGMNPKEFAEQVIEEIKNHHPALAGTPPQQGGEISKIEVAGAGFINFYLNKEFFIENVKEILEQGKDFGKNEIGKDKKILVEYSSPNIAKPFTVGHLRSTIIGDALANIFIFSGYEVIRDNHLGDWGTQFGKMIVALKKWGNIEEIKNDTQPIKRLVELYIRFHEEAEKDEALEDEGREWFKKLEDKNTEAEELWKFCIDISMKEFSKIYDRLKINNFDTVNGESFFEDKMASVIEDIKNKNIGNESEGAYLIFFPDEKKLQPLMVLKKDGSSLYALRDLATDKWRKEKYGNDIIIVNEVGMEQTEYFRQIFEAEEMLGYFPKSQRVHVAHGHYRFKDGKMSTRKGNVIWLNEILDEAEKRAGEININSAKQVALSAIKFNDLKRECRGEIVFDWDEVLNLEGDTGPYIQYTATRAKAVVEKAKDMKLVVGPLNDWQTNDLEKYLARFQEVVLYAGENFAPHHIAIYLIGVAHAFNSFYGSGKIIDEYDPNSFYKVELCKATAIVLSNGLHLLGIEVPEKM